MPNAVLERLLHQRQEQFDFISQVLERVESEGRDLVDAERANLKTSHDRVEQLDAQISPLEEFEALRQSHEASLSRLPAAREARQAGSERDTRPLASAEVREPFPYRSPGAFLVDLLTARGIMQDRSGNRLGPDAEAQARVTRAVANQTTTQTPGLLPVPIVGAVVNIIDASRPLITSLGGAKAMGGIPGKSFERPKITTHVTVGKQTAEKTQLPTQAMQIDPLTFTKETHGGTVNVSRQDIDWTSPAAWDILVNDLANIYAIETEGAVAAAFAASVVSNVVVVAANTLAGWANGLYTAAGQCYAGGKRLPDRLWCSVDMWAQMGSIVDTARLAFPPYSVNSDDGAAGDSNLAQFGGYVFQLPRIVVPTLPNGSVILGSSTLYEAYEETIGLLSVVEPSILGVEVAYGGYLAFGTLEEKGFSKVTAPASSSTGATAGIPGSWTPGGSTPPTTVANLISGTPNVVAANPATAWTTGQYVQTQAAGAGGQAHWSGSAWVAGAA